MSIEALRPPEGSSGHLTLEEVTRLAKATALEHGAHAPTVVLEGSGVLLRVTLNDLPGTHRGRAKALFTAGLAMAETPQLGDLFQAFFISEGWMSRGKKGREPFHPPSEDPQRKEVLAIFQIEVADHKTAMVLLEMRRGRHGKLIGLTDLEVTESTRGKADAPRAESPLLEAFLAGYNTGRAPKLN